MIQLFARKPIASLLADSESTGLKRVLGPGDLIMLAIGAVIGAGVFGAIRPAAPGQDDAAGHPVGRGPGPAPGLAVPLPRVCFARSGLLFPGPASVVAPARRP